MVHDKILMVFSAVCVCATVMAQLTPANAPADVQPPARGLPRLNRNMPGERPGLRGFNSRRPPLRPSGVATPGAPATSAASQNATAEVPMGTNGVPMLAFNQAPLDVVLDAYAQQTGKTILSAPDIPKTQISLKSQALPSKEVYLKAIETILTMNGVTLEPYGENFIKALPTKTVRTHGINLNMKMPDSPLPENTHFISQMITLQYLSANEAQKALEGFKDPNGLFQVFERSNTILVTDKQENINRMLEIVKMLDVKTPLSEEVFEREIKFASAQEIKTVLESIVSESQKEENKDGSATKTSGMPGFSRNRPSSGVSGPRPEMMRPFGPRRFEAPPQPNTPANTPNETLTAVIDDASRGAIRGKVQIISDERSNKLIVITRKENMDFFDKVIAMLDIETQPEVRVELVRLRHADAKELADQLNSFISNSGSSSSSGKSNQRRDGGSANKPANGASGTRPTPPSTPQRPTSLTAAQNSSSGGSTRVGEISKEDTKILADERTRSILIMARSKDMPILLNIIKQIDIKVSQVLIETVIIEVSLSDEIKTGIDWVHGMQRKGTLYNHAIGGGGGSASPVATGGTPVNLIDGAAEVLPTIFAPGSGGLSYALFSRRLDLSAVVSASKQDAHSKYIASPIIMTVDNKEAKIDATENRQFLTGWTAQSSGYSGGGQPTPNYTSKDIGLKLTITPKINPNGTVMLSVEEEYSQFLADAQSMLIPKVTSGSITYETGAVDLAIERKMSADILLENNQTVVLGGLTETKVEKSLTGIPILMDIPWIGEYLFAKRGQGEKRKELLVFLTPYVLDDADAAQAEALRRKNTLSEAKPWDDHGWSGSPLADRVDAKEQLKRKEREWAQEDEERETRKKLENAEKERAEELKERAEEETPAKTNLLGAIKGESQK